MVNEVELVNVVLEDWVDWWEIEVEVVEVWVGDGDLGGEIVLGSVDVGVGVVFCLWEMFSDGEVGVVVYVGYGGEELFKVLWIGVEFVEEICVVVFDFVLGKVGVEIVGEVVLEFVEVGIGYFEEIVDVGWFVFVEKEVGVGGI